MTEEVTGIDLVREQLRVAAGEPLGYTEVATRGHSLEFRINGEDPAAGFLPTPGRLTRLRFPAGPGVRVDSGVAEGDAVSGAFDSMIAKVVVTGATRQQAIERARRALDEMDVAGIPTVLPFHRAVLREPDFAPPDPEQPFAVHTRWIETTFAHRLPTLRGQGAASAASDADGGETDATTERVVVEVGGKRIEVVLPAALGLGAPRGRGAAPRRTRRTPGRAAGAANGTALASPMQGTIVKVAVADGDVVAEGDLVVVLEAMKMEQPLVAHRAGRVTGLAAAVGANVGAGTTICEIVDAGPAA